MARYLIDTNIFTFLATGEEDRISPSVKSLLQDYENEFLMSMQSVLELIVAYRAGKVISKFFTSPLELIESIERDYGIRIIQVDMEVMRTMAKLEINTIEDHNDPSDHLIIAHALTMRLPLISSDHKFPYYQKQGLDLIYNGV
ncbi:MAG: type II toxin-antitoxin system VapC family toxin [Prevotella sp.]|nr:type II toxin-antitoxin system VapC family toxin [Prevotella sp.]